MLHQTITWRRKAGRYKIPNVYLLLCIYKCMHHKSWLKSSTFSSRTSLVLLSSTSLSGDLVRKWMQSKKSSDKVSQRLLSWFPRGAHEATNEPLKLSEWWMNVSLRSAVEMGHSPSSVSLPLTTPVQILTAGLSLCYSSLWALNEDVPFQFEVSLI